MRFGTASEHCTAADKVIFKICTQKIKTSALASGVIISKQTIKIYLQHVYIELNSPLLYLTFLQHFLLGQTLPKYPETEDKHESYQEDIITNNKLQYILYHQFS